MNDSISYCGLLCQGCQIYLASRETDKSKKGEMILGIIRSCKEYYGIEYKYEEINDCDGCKAESGKLFIGCADCKIRSCVIDRGFANCAYCKEYPCDNLKELFKTDPNAKIRLDIIQSSL